MASTVGLHSDYGFMVTDWNKILTYPVNNELYLSEDADDDDVWKMKHPRDWSTDDILDWIYCIGTDHAGIQLSQICGENFQDVNGHQLCTMTREEFRSRDSRYGQLLHDCLQQMLGKLGTPGICNSADEQMIDETLLDEHFWDELQLFTRTPQQNPLYDSTGGESPRSDVCDLDAEVNYHHHQLQPVTSAELHSYFDDAIVRASSVPEAASTPKEFQQKRPRCKSSSTTTKSRHQSNSSTSTDCSTLSDGAAHIKKRRSRIKTRATHLWEFMRSLLEDDRFNPSHVKWENKAEGVFRIVPGQSAYVAELWGIKKKNPSMTFEKMSRSLRWCREHGFFSDVPKNGQYPKKLCFRFGELAGDWKRITIVQ